MGPPCEGGATLGWARGCQGWSSCLIISGINNTTWIFYSKLPRLTRETAMHNITMPPRLNLCGASRSLAFRSRPSIISYQSRISPAVSRRAFADEKTPPTGPNEETLGHVSEEAADMSKIKGETGPDLGQGTPVQEVRSQLLL